MMNDFAARMRWTVTPRRAGANHEPSAKVLNNRRDIVVRRGETVRLHTLVSDPDGDDVTARWWQYREAGTYDGDVSLSGIDTVWKGLGRATMRVPSDAQAGQTTRTQPVLATVVRAMKLSTADDVWLTAAPPAT